MGAISQLCLGSLGKGSSITKSQGGARPTWGGSLGLSEGSGLGSACSPPVISALSRYPPPQPFLGPETLCILHRHIAKTDGERPNCTPGQKLGRGGRLRPSLCVDWAGTWECLCFSSGPWLPCYQVKLFLLPLAVPPTQTSRSKQRPRPGGSDVKGTPVASVPVPLWLEASKSKSPCCLPMPRGRGGPQHIPHPTRGSPRTPWRGPLHTDPLAEGGRVAFLVSQALWPWAIYTRFPVLAPPVS